MPFRRFRKRRRTFRRFGRHRSFGRRRSLARRVARLGRGVKNLRSRIEYKFEDFVQSVPTLALNTGYYLITANPAQGVGSSARIGREIMIHRESIRFFLGIDAPDVAIPSNVLFQTLYVRVILLLDRRCNTPGDPPPVDEIFDLSITDSSPVLAFRNLNYYKHYKIFFDKVYPLSPGQQSVTQAAYVGGRRTLSIRKNFRFRRPIRTVYAADDDESPSENALWWLFISNSPADPDNFQPSVLHLQERVVYSDA